MLDVDLLHPCCQAAPEKRPLCLEPGCAGLLGSSCSNPTPHTAAMSPSPPTLWDSFVFPVHKQEDISLPKPSTSGRCLGHAGRLLPSFQAPVHHVCLLSSHLQSVRRSIRIAEATCDSCCLSLKYSLGHYQGKYIIKIMIFKLS